MSNPWHDVTIGKDVPKILNAVIEIPKNSNLKYELDKESGLMKLDRPLYSAVHYPGDYGFFPKTLADDNDPLDVIVLSNFSVYPNTLVEVRPIGMLEMIDSKEKDDKVIAVYSSDPRMKEYESITNVPDHIKLELKHFFETYKTLQGKEVKVLSLKGISAAHSEIEKSVKRYDEKFGKK